MKKSYKKTKWIDNKTPVCAQYLNKIEDALSEVYEKAIESDDLVGGTGVRVDTNSSGEKEISLGSEVMMSTTCTGIEWCQGVPETWERNKLYFILDPTTKELDKIMLNGITIFNI
ncbi:MAG: hypothetical protein IJ880_07425 [Bacilli bacterium]|nr:hypothetical protein [Bacilli bacterium]